MTGRLGALTIVWFIMSPHVHAQANTDPWQRVPALPTSCFADDGMETTFRELRAVIEDDFRRQRELNLELRKKFENMDVMEKTQRMQAYMQKNPQEAVKMMQAQEQTATGMSADASGAAADREKLMAQRDQLKIAFAKAISDGAGPVEARIQQYVDAKTVLAGEIGRGFPTKAAYDGYVELIAQRNAAYEKACAPVFGAGGSYHTWMADYKTKVAKKLAAASDAQDGIVAQQMVIMQAPTGPGFRPLGPFMSARDYLREAQTVFSIRESKAKPSVPMVMK